jgi:subtilisin family serine protease
MPKINFQLDKNLLFTEVEILIINKILANNPVLKKFVNLRRFYYEDLAIQKHLGIKVDRVKDNKLNPELFQKAYKKMEPAEKKLFNIWQITIPGSNPITEKTLGKLTELLLKELKAFAQFVSLEKEYQLAAFPNDPRFGNLKALRRMQCPQAWTRATGSGVLVAVIDSGIFETHPDINGNLAVDSAGNIIADAFLEGVTSPSVRDFTGHGTHVAGTIAAVGNNSTGIIGVAPDAKIIPIKVFSAATTSTSRNIANAIYFAESKGVQIINNSWYYDADNVPDGGLDPQSRHDMALLSAVRFAISKNVICVFAAGNKNTDVSNYWLVQEPGAIVVAATRLDSDAKFIDSNESVNLTIAAPGEDIESLALSSPFYGTRSGTSMAAAHVSGAIALYLSSLNLGGGRVSPNQVIGRLRNANHSDPASPSIGGFRVNCNRLL